MQEIRTQHEAHQKPIAISYNMQISIQIKEGSRKANQKKISHKHVPNKTDLREQDKISNTRSERKKREEDKARKAEAV